MKYIINNFKNDKLKCFDNFDNLVKSKEQNDNILNNIPNEYSVFSKYYNINKYNCFVFVRNPYTRCVSTFKWILATYEDYDKNKLVPDRRRQLANGNILDRNISFEEFVNLIPEILNNKKKKYNNLKWHLQPQHLQVYCKDNKIINNIYQLENYNHHIKEIMIDLNIENYQSIINVKKNNSNVNNYDNFLNKNVKNKIYNIYKKYFELFNYKY